jgi:hypothetical protein
MSDKIKVQFILKHRESYWNASIKSTSINNYSLSSGLLNSATFVCDALNTTKEIEAELVQVEDNNSIDRETTRFKPDVVIIEAFWVVPEKFEILTKLHPNITWIVRNHSEIPFAAQEGIIMDWSLRYLAYKNVNIAANSYRSFYDMSALVEAAYPLQNKKVIYLPNMYTLLGHESKLSKKESEYLDVACFGAIRPLKNQLLQAVAAINFAKNKHKKLRFHINGGRVEGGSISENVLKNLRLLFNKLPAAELIEHGWYPHDEFLSLLKTMDIGLQVSFSETYNIVSADMVHVGLPIVTSKESLWSPCIVHADPTSSKDILKKINIAWYLRNTGLYQKFCHRFLNNYSKQSLKDWLRALKNHKS